MSRRHSTRTMALVLTLAIISIGSLISMLLVDGIWDLVFLFLAALPLAVGLWRVARAETKSADLVGAF